MSYRTVSIYIQYDTRQRCHWLAGNEHHLGMTADEVADTILNEYIEERFPAIMAHEKRIDALRKDLAKELMKKAHADKTLNP